MVKACIFDLDGVIVDSAKYHFLAWKEMAQSLEIDFTEEHNEQLKGVGRMESLEYILGLKALNLSQIEKEKLAFVKNENYKKFIAQIDASEILVGVVRFLDELKKHNIKIALGSSSKNARAILKYTELMAYFDVIIDGTDINKSKPDPEVFVKGSESLHIDPQDIVVFEDAIKGIEAAKAGGFMSVGVGDPSQLSAADLVIEGFENFYLSDLLKHFNSL
jgi:beta-phosphoglucomutase